MQLQNKQSPWKTIMTFEKKKGGGGKKHKTNKQTKMIKNKKQTKNKNKSKPTPQTIRPKQNKATNCDSVI